VTSANPLPVLGVDTSATSTGVVVLSHELKVLYASAITPAGTGAERLRSIYMALDGIARAYGEFAVVVREGYAVGATNRPYLLGEVSGIAQVALLPHTDRLTECAPKALKKFFTGNACADKKAMMLAADARHGFKTTIDDVADAYALARVAACLAGYLRPTERAALEVIRVIEANDRGEEPAKPAKAPVRRRASVSAFELEL